MVVSSNRKIVKNLPSRSERRILDGESNSEIKISALKRLTCSSITRLSIARFSFDHLMLLKCLVSKLLPTRESFRCTASDVAVVWRRLVAKHIIHTTPDRKSWARGILKEKAKHKHKLDFLHDSKKTSHCFTLTFCHLLKLTFLYDVARLWTTVDWNTCDSHYCGAKLGFRKVLRTDFTPNYLDHLKIFFESRR